MLLRPDQRGRSGAGWHEGGSIALGPANVFSREATHGRAQPVDETAASPQVW